MGGTTATGWREGCGTRDTIDMPSGWLGLDWGNVPTWLGATLTSGSLVVAANSYRRSVLDKERDQASKVAAWFALTEDLGIQKRVLRLRNSSDAPVFDLTVTVNESMIVRLSELPQGATPTYDLIDSAGRTVRPTVRRVSISIETLLDLEVSRDTVMTNLGPALEFRDSVGRWWARDNRGNLKRMKSRIRAHVYGVRLWFIHINWGESGLHVERERINLWPPRIDLMTLPLILRNKDSKLDERREPQEADSRDKDQPIEIVVDPPPATPEMPEVRTDSEPSE